MTNEIDIDTEDDRDVGIAAAIACVIAIILACPACLILIYFLAQWD